MEIHIFEVFGMIQHLNIGKTSSQMPQTAPSDMASEDRTAVAIRSYGSWSTPVRQLRYARTPTAVRCPDDTYTVGSQHSPKKRAQPRGQYIKKE